MIWSLELMCDSDYLGMLVAHIPVFQYKGHSLTMARSLQGHS